jgi:hypothetical protein
MRSDVLTTERSYCLVESLRESVQRLPRRSAQHRPTDAQGKCRVLALSTRDSGQHSVTCSCKSLEAMAGGDFAVRALVDGALAAADQLSAAAASVLLLGGGPDDVER